MSNITFDFSDEKIFHQTKNSIDNSNYTYRDINTSDILYTGKNEEKKIVQASSNFDLNAIKASLNNILNFKNGESILEPEFGIGKVYEMLYTPFDKYTTEKMIRTIKDILKRWEPRIEVLSIPVQYSEDKQEYHMTINYYVPMLDVMDALKYIIQK